MLSLDLLENRLCDFFSTLLFDRVLHDQVLILNFFFKAGWKGWLLQGVLKWEKNENTGKEISHIEAKIKTLAGLVSQANRIVIFTGAGISTESGIPDFRGPGGVWEKFDPNEFNFDRFLSSAESRKKYWLRSMSFYQGIAEAQPNQAHLAVTDLEKMNKLSGIITQNVDGLHQKAGTSEEKVIELHGTSHFVDCLSCGLRKTRAEFQPQVSPEGVAPDCEKCGGIMKPATISFGQNLKPETLEKASAHTEACDLFLVIGSSLVVYPAAGFPVMAARKNVPLAIINLQETPHDEYAKVIFREAAGEVLPLVVAAAAS